MVELLPGQSFRAFSKNLVDQKIISPTEALYFEMRFRFQHSPAVHRGEYLLTPNITPQALLEKLKKGEVVHYPFTIVEGFTLKEITQRIAALPKLKYQYFDAADAKLCQPFRGNLASIEGLMLPETYFYVKNDTPEQLINRACQSMAKTVNHFWVSRDLSLPFNTPYAFLVMASIIEKESAYLPERPLIAGVFYNRLEKGMRLQTDPTVIYGLGEKYSGKLTHEDLLVDTPYNTYTRKGLPPTPIASPSRESIEAALHPEHTTALFFVAKKDRSHIFADTYEAHLQNIAHYLKDEGKAQ